MALAYQKMIGIVSISPIGRFENSVRKPDSPKATRRAKQKAEKAERQVAKSAEKKAVKIKLHADDKLSRQIEKHEIEKQIEKHEIEMTAVFGRILRTGGAT